MSLEHQQGTGNINSFNVLTNYNFITERDNEERQILQWLSPLEPQLRHQGVRTERLDGVGSRILETSEFRKWSDTEDGYVDPVLFCYGNPGVGKTYLSSLVIDSLCDQAAGRNIAVVGLYCDFLAQQEQSTTNILGAILKQLFRREGIPEHIREAFQKAKKEFGGRGLRVPDLVETLKKTITSLLLVYICIDALDESVPKYRRELLESLQEIVRESPNTRVFLTGRSHVDDEIMKCFSKAVRTPISPTQDDIKSYLEMRLAHDTDPNAMDDKLRADIMRVIPDKIAEIFLLVSLNMDAILGEITIHQRRKNLDEMAKGEGLGDAYTATLLRVKSQQGSRSKIGMDVLMWVSHSERPLHVNELCHALGVEEGSTDLNVQNVPAISTLLACCLGLVTVEKSSSTVRPIHYTLKEHLSHNPNLFLKPHSTIAEVCLTYLNFRHVRGFSPVRDSAPPTAPFVEYASCYWGTHAQRETTESVKMLALKLLDGYDEHISSKMLLLHGMSDPNLFSGRDSTPKGFTGLHAAAYLGCVEITVALLEMNKWDVKAIGFRGHTPIALAARRGHEGVVKILLEQNDVDPNKGLLASGRTPLSLAAGNGHDGVVRMLLERSDINPNQSNKHGLTLRQWATGCRNIGVIRVLALWKDPLAMRDDRAPLSWAAENGHEGVVRILLEQNDVNPNTADKKGRTPLSWAAGSGREGIVRILLERNDVNPNTADKKGRTPLSWAARNGSEGIMRILLERNDVNSNKADKKGLTPLSWAAGSGRRGAVRILLERNDAKSNKADKEGRTLLSWAAGSGLEGVARALLEQNDVNPNTADKKGRTPLSWAVESGSEGVVMMLLERNDVSSNIADKEGRTPLWWAAANKRERITMRLLERNDAKSNKADKEGRTPPSWAAGSGLEGVVRILLEQNDVNSNKADKKGLTPLSWAARSGRGGVVRILLERNDAKSDEVDQEGRTPLSRAAGGGHEEVIRILLERNDVSSNIADKEGRTPLQWATMRKHRAVTRILREGNNVSHNTRHQISLNTIPVGAR